MPDPMVHAPSDTDVPATAVSTHVLGGGDGGGGVGGGGDGEGGGGEGGGGDGGGGAGLLY